MDTKDLNLIRFFGGSYTEDDTAILSSNYRFNRATGEVTRLKSIKNISVFTFAPFSAKYFYAKAASFQLDSNASVIDTAIDMYLKYHKYNSLEVQAGLITFNFLVPTDLQRFALRRPETFRFVRSGKQFMLSIVDPGFSFTEYEFKSDNQIFDPYSASHDLEPALPDREPDWSWTDETETNPN